MLNANILLFMIINVRHSMSNNIRLESIFMTNNVKYITITWHGKITRIIEKSTFDT